MLRTLLAIAALACALQAAPAAAARALPEDAKFGVFTVVQHPEVTLNRASFRLAPGAQIRDESNRIVLPTSLEGRFRVLYTIDVNGDVFRVWILSAEEIELFRSRR